jgi:PAS domain S-box-containing protein
MVLNSVLNDGGPVPYLQSLVRVVSRISRKAFEARRVKEHLRVMTDALPVLIAYVDHHEVYQFCNAAYAEWFNRSKKNLVGQKVSQVLGPELYKIASPYIKQVLAGEAQSGQVQAIRDGRDRSFSFKFIPDGRPGSVRGYFVLVTDITEFKEIERQLEEAKLAAESANSAKSSFLAFMSHEIRGPLGIMMGFAEVLQDADLAPSARNSYLAAIVRNGELLSSIVNDILDLSKVEAGMLHVRGEAVVVRDLVREVVEGLRHSAQKKGVGLELSFHSNVPDTINTDPLRLRQIIYNLVGNAVKFTDHGQVSVKVKLENNLLALTVKDTGCGIASNQLEKLFAHFGEITRESTEKGGAGLGLMLSRKLAKLLGGDVALLESAVDRGSTFRATVNPSIELPKASKTPPSPSRQASRPGEFTGLRVLIADDAEDSQILLGHILRSAGMIVHSAFNGREAIEIARAVPFDLILMDIQMPEVDGYTAATKLREEGYSGKIVALTAHAMGDTKAQCMTDGAFNAFLSKPIRREDLFKGISQVLLKA